MARQYEEHEPKRKRSRQARHLSDSADHLIHHSRTRTYTKKKTTHIRRDEPSGEKRSEVSSQALSEDSLAKLNAFNDRLGWSDYDRLREKDRQAYERGLPTTRRGIAKKDKRTRDERQVRYHRRERQRDVSGHHLEKAVDRHDSTQRSASLSSQDDDGRARRRRRRICWHSFNQCCISITDP